MKDGSALILGCNQWSTNSDIFSVILLQLDTYSDRVLVDYFVGNIVWMFLFGRVVCRILTCVSSPFS